ncbi:MAG: hypothetical protein PHQ66_02400 [Candidatus Nanoarchaeia archaeon]|nr:hypothetical protein [Candidatus Nanoarchaeia archaeon]MDD5357780.1 hypothetical protein [Candidatus Nanoarchaeia archaeon]MDD5588699.1 hypothetical protein [Candidatus Nanoarchaeia archaeon]
MKEKRNFNFVMYIFYFIAFSFLGSLMEYLFGLVGGRGIAYDKGLFELLNLKLYFIPYYGFVGVILIFFEKLLEKKKVKFVYWGILNAVIILAWELIGGLFSLIVFGHKLWDYSNHFLNFMGIISLQMFLIWIVLGYLFSFLYRHIITFLNRFLL